MLLPPTMGDIDRLTPGGMALTPGVTAIGERTVAWRELAMNFIFTGLSKELVWIGDGLLLPSS